VEQTKLASELYRGDRVTQGVASELNPDRPIGGLLQLATTRFGKNKAMMTGAQAGWVINPE